jgi:AraC-like DNA-binding protein/quercetin dioxygenase-like cupin family protein
MENQRTVINPNPGSDEVTVLFAGESVTFPRHAVGSQVHDYYLIHYVLSGCGTFHCRDKQYSLTAGESFFIFPGEVVSYEADAEHPWKYRWIALQEGPGAAKLMDQLQITPEQPTSVPAQPRKLAATYWQLQQCLRQGDDSCDLRASAYARLILSHSIRPSDRPKDRTHTDSSIARKQVDQAARYMSLQYYQDISIEAMAREMGYHRTHFCKIFKQITGASPFQYLTKVRMKQAARLLKEPLTVQQVASAVGYQDALYFSKQFKRYYGVAPSLYISTKLTPK